MLLLAALELMVACGSQHPVTGPPASFVVGTVTAGPISPVQRPGKPNARPAPGATIEALRGSDAVAVARANDRGHYRLTVRPGTYLIRVKPPAGYLPRNQVKTVTISGGETLTVNFLLDTGIR